MLKIQKVVWPKLYQPDRQSRPCIYGHSVSIALTEHTDPSSVSEVRSAPDRLKWENAMETEMRSLLANKVWELVEPPPNRKIIGSKWVFKWMIDANETVDHYKARLVAQGCTQTFGPDYEETFSPIVQFESIRFLLAVGAQHKLQLYQMDVSTAFLHGELNKEVYMWQLEGFIESGIEYLVCHLW